MRLWPAGAMLLALAWPAIAQTLLPWSEEERAAIARHGPWPPPPVRDPSNRISGMPAGIVLGEYLFNDPRLSADGRMSCSTCHIEGRDWGDGRARAMGRGELDRRTQTLWNVGYGHWFGWDGAGDSLWAQSIRPILDPREMAGDAARVARLLREDPALACGYQRAYGEKPGTDDEKLLVDTAKAMAAFQATLVSPRTPFDAFHDALQAGDAATAAHYPLAAQRGLKIFIAANCSACHFGPRFTNGEFGDVGIPFSRGRARSMRGGWTGSTSSPTARSTCSAATTTIRPARRPGGPAMFSACTATSANFACSACVRRDRDRSCTTATWRRSKMW